MALRRFTVRLVRARMTSSARTPGEWSSENDETTTRTRKPRDRSKSADDDDDTLAFFFRTNACLENLSSFSGNSICPMRHACAVKLSVVTRFSSTKLSILRRKILRFPAVRDEWPRSGTTAVLKRGRSPRAYLKFWLYTFSRRFQCNIL